MAELPVDEPVDPLTGCLGGLLNALDKVKLEMAV